MAAKIEPVNLFEKFEPLGEPCGHRTAMRRDLPTLTDSVRTFREMIGVEGEYCFGAASVGVFRLTRPQCVLVLNLMADLLEGEVLGRAVKVMPDGIQPRDVLPIMAQWFSWLCEAFGTDPQRLASIHAAYDAARLALSDIDPTF